jgi:hypothetical protein
MFKIIEHSWDETGDLPITVLTGKKKNDWSGANTQNIM